MGFRYGLNSCESSYKRVPTPLSLPLGVGALLNCRAQGTLPASDVSGFAVEFAQTAGPILSTEYHAMVVCLHPRMPQATGSRKKVPVTFCLKGPWDAYASHEFSAF